MAETEVCVCACTCVVRCTLSVGSIVQKTRSPNRKRKTWESRKYEFTALPWGGMPFFLPPLPELYLCVCVRVRVSRVSPFALTLLISLQVMFKPFLLGRTPVTLD